MNLVVGNLKVLVGVLFVVGFTILLSMNVRHLPWRRRNSGTYVSHCYWFNHHRPSTPDTPKPDTDNVWEGDVERMY